MIEHTRMILPVTSPARHHAPQDPTVVAAKKIHQESVSRLPSNFCL